MDNFALPTDPATPSPGVVNFIGTHPLVSYDDPRNNVWFGDSFTIFCPPGTELTAAELIFALKPTDTGTSGSRNDAINLGFYNANGTINTIYNVSIETLLPPNSDWSTFTSGHTFVLDLANLPVGNVGPTNLLALLNSKKQLDIVIQDDTSVDYMTLNYTCCTVPELRPLPLFSLGLGGWLICNWRRKESQVDTV